jgi:hypothetical protein
VTAEDGKFEFHGVPPGKYSLTGAKRGFITAAYDQHDQFSTAIVTGAGIDTDALVLRLAPAAMISGRILDESGEPVRHASVTLYYQDHSNGVDEIHQSHGAQTDDQGEYEIPSLMAGTYFLSASAKPWYALHPQSEPTGTRSRRKSQPDPPENFDRSLDVAYPVTYYSDVTETDTATPIPIRGGEHVQLDVHLNPVPSLHLLFHTPVPADHGYTIPQLEQPAFDGATFVQADTTRVISPGLVEISGIPAGRYNILIREPGQPGVSVRMNGVDVAKDHQEISTNSAEAVSSVKVSVKVPGATTLPDRLSIGLRSSARNFSGGKPVDAKGEVELPQMAPGRYEVRLWLSAAVLDPTNVVGGRYGLGTLGDSASRRFRHHFPDPSGGQFEHRRHSKARWEAFRRSDGRAGSNRGGQGCRTRSGNESRSVPPRPERSRRHVQLAECGSGFLHPVSH